MPKDEEPETQPDEPFPDEIDLPEGEEDEIQIPTGLPVADEKSGKPKRMDGRAKELMRQMQEQMREEPKSIQEQPFQNLSVIIMNLLSSTQPRQYVNLYVFIKIFAKRLKRNAIVKDLDKMFKGVEIVGKNGKTFKIPLSILQFMYDRDSMLGYSPAKTYQKRNIKLGDIIIALDGVKEKLLDIYMILCEEHNIPLEAPQNAPVFSAADADDLPDTEGF